ncbi:MAG: LON peptidase substrate-binding domain-containing protein [Ferruginibacter sp.]|nr:LON peptidase substrate-binding domain-containing protein [Ferruginibacter sp.]
MTNFIPIFPLGLIVFPDEKLNLHIFEPRYQQLVKYCFENKKPFGIPSVIKGELKEMGTLVRIIEISKTYDDGTMDIKTEGTEVFKILEVIKTLPDKLYSGAIVTYPPNMHSSHPSKMKLILTAIREMYKKMKVEKTFSKPDKNLRSFDLAHLIGFSQEEEYLMLELQSETHRLEFIKRHLSKIIPVMTEIEELRKKIKLNGHFKNIKGFKL